MNFVRGAFILLCMLPKNIVLGLSLRMSSSYGLIHDAVFFNCSLDGATWSNTSLRQWRVSPPLTLLFNGGNPTTSATGYQEIISNVDTTGIFSLEITSLTWSHIGKQFECKYAFGTAVYTLTIAETEDYKNTILTQAEETIGLHIKGKITLDAIYPVPTVNATLITSSKTEDVKANALTNTTSAVSGNLKKVVINVDYVVSDAADYITVYLSTPGGYSKFSRFHTDVITTTAATTSQTTTELVTTSTESLTTTQPETTSTDSVSTTFKSVTTSMESLTTTQPETTSTDSVSTTSKSVTPSTESLTTTQPETTSTDSVSTTSKSVTTSMESLTTTQPEATGSDSVSTTSKSETTTKSYTGSIVTESDLTTNQPTTTPVADGSSVMTTVGHTSNTKLSGLSRDEIIAIGSIVGFFIILFIVAIVTYVVYTRIRNNKNTKNERENQEQYLKDQGQMNRHEYRFNDYNTRGYLYSEGFNIKQEKGERYRAQGGDPNKRQKMMTTRSYTTYQQPRGHDYNHYKSANTISTYYPMMYGESHNYGFDMEMSPYIESFQYYTGSTHGSTHGSYYNHQNPERSGGRHHGRYQERQGRPYPATSNYYYPNGQYYY